ncbi:MAG: hypothetical protein FWD27_00740 [Coriobacteriia bacterium]|nr:hypothetical protein [Coriobacteriia bacterium]
MAADKADGITVSINGKPVKTRIIRVYVGELADSAALVDSVYLEVVKASYQTSIGKPSKPYLTALKALGLTEKEERSKEALEAISELVKSLPALRCKDVKLPKPAAKPATALTAKPSAKKNEEEKDEESKDEPAQAPKQPVLTSKKAITYLAAQIAQGNLTMEQLKVELEKQLDRCYKALDEAKALDSKKKIA